MMAKQEEEEEEGSSPNEAIFFVLAYLPVFELLSMARVCTSLRDAVKNDRLAWLRMVVDRPLNRRVSDDRLVEVASMAEGRLQALVLINCLNITDDGLFTLIHHNPLITKLHIPGCTSLSAGGVVRAVQLLTKDNHRLRSLKISGIYGVRREDLQTLRGLVEHNVTRQERGKMLYHHHNKIESDDDPCIDVDICPKCNDVRMVFDCPRHLCECRGCDSCIVRCIECGVCIKVIDQEAEAAACADALCLTCWLKLPKCNFCNKPYCSLHANHQYILLDSPGFICATCHSKFN
ncbi:F-box protein SKIP28 [Salvia miltiorrhiza]|uniref:F-box protein SKIP28 n=1 Tax=Salvia miltiorrhiza TaxID=226208 RepID=UPI0025ABB1F2|nr:F-box protein SKIP28 [Salvia miltiorrhiza]